MSEINGKSNGFPAHYPSSPPPEREEEEGSLFGEIDLGKLWIVFKRNLFWLFLLPVASLIAAFLFLRYTRPLFKSASSLRLDVKNQSSILGLQALVPEEGTDLSGEIELIKSKLVYDEVIKMMNLPVSYFAEGNILDEERYLNSPFRVDHQMKNPVYYDTHFDVRILDRERFQLGYVWGDRVVSETHSFGQTIENADFRFVLYRQGAYDVNLAKGNFYFVVNHLNTLNEYVAKNLQVTVINPNARLIGISFADHNPYKARDMVNAIDSVYLTTTLNNKNKANKQKIGYLEAQLRQAEDSLDRYEKEMQNFVVANRSADLQSDIGRDFVRIEEVLEKKVLLNTKLAYLRDLEPLLNSERNLADFIPFLAKELEPQLVQAISDLNRIQLERTLLRSSLKENTLSASARESALRVARKNAAAVMRQERALLSGQLWEANRRISQLEGSLVNKPIKNAEYTKIKRTHGLYEGYYLDMMSKKAEIGIAGAGMVPEFVVLSPASLPKTPVWPNKLLVYGIGGLIGIFISFVSVVGMYFLNNTITSQRELEKIAFAPVLGIVPILKQKKESVSRMVIDKNPKSAISEALRLIRTNLDFMFPSQKKKRIIAVTSTVSGEGKTFIVVNLGGIIALSDTKVVLLDLDMRRPKIHVAFDAENRTGISTLLIGKHQVDECIQKTAIPTLDFIAAGPAPPNPSELILRPEFDRLLAELGRRYDYILIDTPPVGLVTDGILVMSKSDLPLYVVRADYSKRSVVSNINKLLRNERFRNLTVILNALRSEKDVYKYDYGGYNQGYYDEAQPKPSGLKKLEKLLLGR
ncbi:MAG: polysaccharide biosynthesis tyrosine autokinase [Ferruginibacter sp.]|nr:polysaccharide biosynthesis tyrosine autokinase [Cytophagales bacterium]